LKRALRDVCKIADRCGDEVESAGRHPRYLRQILNKITGLAGLTG
jgi:hypothetical protein